MPDKSYCYPNTDVLINKLGIKNAKELYEAEKRITSIEIQELSRNPLKGNFDFDHLKSIHKHIFQDIYEWAGEIRTVEIGKGNLFCTTPCINVFDYCSDDLQIELSTGEIISLEELDNLLDEKLIDDNEISR